MQAALETQQERAELLERYKESATGIEIFGMLQRYTGHWEYYS
jgi:hypothetical protein